MPGVDLPRLAMNFVILLPAIILHEVAHGYAAFLLGDTTAKDQGRLSLNPLKHIDPWGTILLPLLLLAATGGRAALGYAKPVPVNHWWFKDPQHGMFLVGLAGPGANLVLGVVAGLLLRLRPETISGVVPETIVFVIFTFAYMNLVLLFFNLIPIPPLDGSRVAQRFLRGSALAFYAKIERYGFIIVFALLWLAPWLLDAYMAVTVVPLIRLLVGT